MYGTYRTVYVAKTVALERQQIQVVYLMPPAHDALVNTFVGNLTPIQMTYDRLAKMLVV